MEKFTTLTGIAAPLLRPNINTDVIIRVEHLGFTPREELGPYAFEAWRYLPDGGEDPDFILNRPPFREPRILLTAENFGCGSSREAAVWALESLGIRCVVAPSFGDIFRNNCFQNGLLPVELPIEKIRELAVEISTSPATAFLTVDLVTCTITGIGGSVHPFQVDAMRRAQLLQGLDEITATLARRDQVEAFEAQDRVRRPWIQTTAGPATVLPVGLTS